LIGGKVIGVLELKISYWALDYLRRNEKEYNIVHFFDFTGFYPIKMKNQFGMLFKNLNLIYHKKHEEKPLSLEDKWREEVENSTLIFSDLSMDYRPFKISHETKIEKLESIILLGSSFEDFLIFEKLRKEIKFDSKMLFFMDGKEQNLILNEKSISFVDSFLKLKTWILSKENHLVLLTRDHSIVSVLMENNFPFLLPKNSLIRNLYPKNFLYDPKNTKSSIEGIVKKEFKIYKDLKMRSDWDSKFIPLLNKFETFVEKEQPNEKIAIVVRSSQNFENLNFLMDSILEQTYKSFEVVVVADNNNPGLFHHLRNIKKKFRQFNINVMVTFSPIEHHGIGIFFDQGFEYFKNFDYFLFVDSEHVIMKPILLESFIKSMKFKDLDIVTSFYDIMPKDRVYPWPWEDEFYKRKLYIGSIENSGALENIYGGEVFCFI
jgi:hypothetical protein